MEIVRGTAGSLIPFVYRTHVRSAQVGALGAIRVLEPIIAQYCAKPCRNNLLAQNSSNYKIAHKFNRRTNLLDRLLMLASRDRKSTRLNSSHTVISYAVFCLKKKKHEDT